MELRNILQRCTQKSLVLGDELCAGTESISALAIVTAGIDMLIKKQACFVFATHLHDLSKLTSIQDASNKTKKLKLAHMHVEVDKVTGKLIFDRELRDGIGSSLYGLEVCYGLGLPTEFLNKAHEVRSEIENISPLLQTTKQSHYNTAIFVQECKICNKERASEVHHIKEQHTASIKGFIDHYHKNNAHNLIPLCESCHQEVHHGTLKIHGYKQTTDGIILDYIKEDLNSNPIMITNTTNTTNITNTINNSKIHDTLYPYLRYNKSTWYHKKTTRSKWKIITDISDVLSIIKTAGFVELTSKEIGSADHEEIMHDFENILYDRTL
jgi:DNA mismatch repair protein MutS